MFIPPDPMLISPETLLARHRLSSRQVNDYLKGRRSVEPLEERLIRMEKLRCFLMLTRSLQQEGIWFMVLKGPVLSSRIYGDPCYRYYKDFDLLVKPESIRKVTGILKKAGFKPAVFDWPESSGREQKVLSHMNQYTLLRADKGMAIELHWRFFKYHILPRRVFHTLLVENLEEIQIGGQSFLQFNKEMELLYLVVHGGVHAWSRLKWLVDIHELLNRFSLDEEKFLKLSGRLGTQRLVSLCDALLQKYFPGSKRLPGSGRPLPVLLNYAQYRIENKLDIPFETAGEDWSKIRYRLMALPGIRYKLSTLKFSTFTEKELNRKWPPPSSLLVIIRLFFHRIFRVYRRTDFCFFGGN